MNKILLPISIILLALALLIATTRIVQMHENLSCTEMANQEALRVASTEDDWVYPTLTYRYAPKAKSCLFLKIGVMIGDPKVESSTITDLFSGEILSQNNELNAETHNSLVQRYFRDNKLGDLLK